MTFRIGIDISGLSWKYKTGVQNLYFAFLKTKSVNSPDMQMRYLDFDNYNQDLKEMASSPFKKYQSSIPSALSFLPNPEFFAKVRSKIYHQDLFTKLDAFHVWNWKLKYSKNCSNFITVPDIIPLTAPQFFKDEFIQITKKSIDFAKNQAKHVVAISHHCKQDMVDHCHIPADKITVIYPGIRELFFSSPKQDEAIIKKYSLTKNNYIMTIGFMDPRKNLIAQIKAFEELILRKKDLPDSFKIVITGPESGLSVEINELLKRATLKNRVVLTGYLEDQILLTLLDHCNFLSYCSLYEGFGLPVIEAMARKIPVVTSDNSSLYEIAKDHAHICSATSTDSMTSAYIECLEENFDKKEKRILAAHQYAQDFTEENWCLKHFQLFRNKA